VWAGVFAAISLYWALGGMIGIDTVGGQIEELVRSGDPAGSLASPCGTTSSTPAAWTRRR
jgi:hypothetical protein